MLFTYVPRMRNSNQKNKDLRSRSIANYMTSEGNSALLPENVDRSSRFTLVNLYTLKYWFIGRHYMESLSDLCRKRSLNRSF